MPAPSLPPQRTLPRSVSLPVPAVTKPPWVALALLVMMLITPLTALAPHSVAPGPRITSIRSTSSSGTSCTSQKTPENRGV